MIISPSDENCLERIYEEATKEGALAEAKAVLSALLPQFDIETLDIIPIRENDRLLVCVHLHSDEIYATPFTSRFRFLGAQIYPRDYSGIAYLEVKYHVQPINFPWIRISWYAHTTDDFSTLEERKRLLEAWLLLTEGYERIDADRQRWEIKAGISS